MNFVHESLEIIGDVKQKNISGKRLYETPDGNFPSITTVLSSLSKASIQEWRNRVGAEEANRISTQASRRGTKTHSIIEDYLQNKQDYLSGHMPDSIELFKSVQSILDIHIDNITEDDYEFWVVAFLDENGEDLFRLDADENEVLTLIEQGKNNKGWINLWRQYTGPVPAKWRVWPFSKSKEWCERLEGDINIAPV